MAEQRLHAEPDRSAVPEFPVTRLRIPVSGPVCQHYTSPDRHAYGVKWSRGAGFWLLSGGAFGHALAIGWMWHP